MSGGDFSNECNRDSLMHCTPIYYSGIKKTASPLNELCMSVLNTIMSARDAANFLSRAKNNSDRAEISEYFFAEFKKPL
jgi:hypothetical protein